MDPNVQDLLKRTKQKREELNMELGLANLNGDSSSTYGLTVQNYHSNSKHQDDMSAVGVETKRRHETASVFEEVKKGHHHNDNSSVTEEARKSRAAALAAKIGSWEDDISHHSTLSSASTANTTTTKSLSSHRQTIIKHVNFTSSSQQHQPLSTDNVHFKSPPQQDGANFKSSPQRQNSLENKHGSSPIAYADDEENDGKAADCGVESFFVRRNSSSVESPEIDIPQQHAKLYPSLDLIKNQDETTTATATTVKNVHVEKPKYLKRELAGGAQGNGKVFAMANKWENQILKNDAGVAVGFAKPVKAPATPPMCKRMKPVLPCATANDFNATKTKIASTLPYVNVRPSPGGSPGKRAAVGSDVQKVGQQTVGENRDLNKLKNRWEVATQRGIALQPEQSLSQYDIVQAALKMAQPRGLRSPMVAKEQGVAKKPVDGRYSSNIEVRVLPKILPNIVSTSNIVLDQPKVDVTKPDDKPLDVMSAESSYDAGSSDNSEFVDSAELDACLNEAINSATLHAAQRTPTRTPNRIIHDDKSSTEPLLYTVSMYRKMQKDQSREPTPLKAVIKPPSSPRRNANNDAGQHLEKNPGVYESRVKHLTDAITVQQEQIYQASRALNYCRNNEEFRGSTEEVNAHKVLLVAGERRKALQQELERVHSCRKQRKPLDSNDPLGTLIFQYISLSLKREFVNDRINSMGDYVYYFICTLKYRDQLITTQVVDSDVAVSAGGRMEFPNYFQLNSLPHDFNIEVSVFALQTKREELSHEQKYRLNGQTLKHKQRPNSAVLTNTSSLGGPGGVLDTNFRLVGQVNLTLSSVNRQKFALQGYQFVAPLEPVIHLKVRCCADSVGTVEEKGFLSVYEEITDLGSWHRRWCTLKHGVLRFWRYPDEETTKDPVSTIDLIDCVTKTVGLVAKEICTRPNTFVLNMIGDTTDVYNHLLSADNKEECLGWCEKMNQALHNLRLWNVDESS